MQQRHNKRDYNLIEKNNNSDRSQALIMTKKIMNNKRKWNKINLDISWGEQTGDQEESGNEMKIDYYLSNYF